MNPIAQWCEDNGVDEIAAMNELQDRGVISDLCVGAADVATDDIASALWHLRQWKKGNK